MRSRRDLAAVLVACTFVLSAAAAPARDGRDTKGGWREASCRVGAPDDKLGAAARQVLERVSDWARKAGYVLRLSADERVVYATHLEGKPLAAREKLIEQTLAAFDALAPEPKRAEELPADPPAWGVVHQPEQGTLLLAELRDADDYVGITDRLAEQISAEPQIQHLAGWLRENQGQPGLISLELLTGAWQEAPENYEIDEVWRSENELVHRLAQLLVYRRFGEQPQWLRTAVAWSVEQKVLGSIYCFPARKGFVGIGEHDGWQVALKAEFERRTKKEPLVIEELSGWKLNRWDEERAAHAWGLLQYLSVKHKAELAPFLEEMRLFRVEHGREVHDDGSWELIRGYDIPAEEQLRMLNAHFGASCLADASQFFRDWKGWKSPAAPAKPGGTAKGK